ncbi:oligosaccharide biosynthesis protein alg14 like domain-containing protein [Hirsutella rhossiliensis]|uniref:UDP-N-acetylglucosamine transferase subunit ALG14 n=1 Tax=Hirsutella rhossiliensis TaxID=111463 RepID=A0A9P8SLZ7_9HYPO|nr:oligosaccharide biosynthesis protein alg14 like domain-containing protein [Hirsutella rhossiliensis]KAH0966305.1 oligosaccharide biosynthesis protein alg14 like domain-containing protein [Hirsutella rhossiliensis]
MRSSLAVLSGIMAIAGGTGLASVWIVRSWRTVLLTCLALLIALAIFTTARHVQLLQRRRSRQWPQPPRRADGPSAQRPSHDYYLFVLGSGGHTKEMLMMMDDGFCAFANFHRRYLISSGDRMSRHHLQDYEEQLEQLCRAAESSPGTHDTRTVTRARRVHQSLWTTPFTSLVSIVDIFSVLLSPPANEAGRRLRYPRLILSNGPATGFFVALVAHVLKVFFIVPEDCMRFVYIESWARISTLSLTGKLLLYTGIADALYVQHQQVAAMYGLVNAGEMVFNSRRPDA